MTLGWVCGCSPWPITDPEDRFQADQAISSTQSSRPEPDQRGGCSQEQEDHLISGPLGSLLWGTHLRCLLALLLLQSMTSSGSFPVTGFRGRVLATEQESTEKPGMSFLFPPPEGFVYLSPGPQC